MKTFARKEQDCLVVCEACTLWKILCLLPLDGVRSYRQSLDWEGLSCCSLYAGHPVSQYAMIGYVALTSKQTAALGMFSG